MKKKLFSVLIAISIILTLTPENTAQAEELPETYRSTGVTPAKDQRDSNLCWAFATIAAMEADLIQNHGADKNLDLSELQIGCFRRNSAMDPLGQQHMMFSGSNNIFNGGRNFVVGALMGTGLSPIEEALVPVSFEEATDATRLDESLAFTGRYYMKEFQVMCQPSRDTVKKAVMKYGGVAVDVYTDQSNYNKDTYAWYNPEFVSINHMVCIVGWDDNFSKKNFKTAPPEDGAWIVKNSWGEEWGDKGFYYISYYDACLLHARAEYGVYDMEPGKYADNLYQNAFQVTSYLGSTDGKTDWTKKNNGCSASKVANIFTAQANETGAESLTAVSLYTFEASDYVIHIYKNVKDSNNPESGTLAATLKGKIDVPGFRIIPLDKPLYLSEGESYSVVASLKNKEGKNSGVAKSDNTQTMTTPTYGQSYIYIEGKKQWEDLSLWSQQNLYLNAYTDNIKADAAKDAKKVTMKQSYLEYKEEYIPKDVADVSLDYVDATTAVISWEETKNTEYIVYQYNKTADAWRKLDFVDRGKDYFVIEDLTPGHAYTFGVKAVTPLKEGSKTYMQSLQCSAVDIKTSEKVQTEPVLLATEKGNKITWEAVPQATLYQVYCMSPLTEYEWKECGNVFSGGELSFLDEKVVKGLTYSYRVYAFRGGELLGKGTPVTAVFE